MLCGGCICDPMSTAPFTALLRAAPTVVYESRSCTANFIVAAHTVQTESCSCLDRAYDTQPITVVTQQIG